MALSMTGFGRGVVKGKSQHYIVEVRSVNNRFCEVKVTAPREMLTLEHKLACLVKDTFARGKFEVLLKTEKLKSQNENRSQELIQHWLDLDSIRKKLGLPKPVSLEAAIQFRSFSRTTDENDPQSYKFFRIATNKALMELKKFRLREGKALTSDISQRAKILDENLRKIEHLVIPNRKARLEKLKTKLKGLVDGVQIDRKRLEMEIAILVDRTDIEEEIVRLKSHILRLQELLLSSGSVGREFDFLLQEMNREINTIGSKATDLTVTKEVIRVKSEIEKIREQAQNLE